MNCDTIYTRDPRRVKRAINQIRQYRRHSLTRPPRPAPSIASGNLFKFSLNVVSNVTYEPPNLLTSQRVTQTFWRRVLRVSIREAQAAGLPRYASDTHE